MSESKKNILLKITDEGLYYNETSFFSWDATNFPDKIDFNWREGRPIYWLVEMLEFNTTTQCLDLSIVSYQPSDIKSFNTQNSKKQIRRLHFYNLSWPDLQGQLRSYVYKAFRHLDEKEIDEEIDLFAESNEAETLGATVDPLLNALQINRHIPLEYFTFHNGYVEARDYVGEIQRSIDIKIFNDVILAHFDHIKPYFKKYFKGRRIGVKGMAKRSADGTWQANCRSAMIQDIDEEAISSIRRLVLKDKIAKPIVIDVDKSLFTSTDIFLDENNIDLGKALNARDIDMFNDIFTLKNVRNRKQLIYLSGKVQKENMPIRFTLAPQFGFLFYSEGADMSHFIWELLNSNATYIWSAFLEGRPIDVYLKEVERLINFIRSNGRRAYLIDVTHDFFVFSKIAHKDTNSTIKDAFPMWKAKLDERLV